MNQKYLDELFFGQLFIANMVSFENHVHLCLSSTRVGPFLAVTYDGIVESDAGASGSCKKFSL